MYYERYTHLEISKDALEYKFISLGPYGAIQKVIQFKDSMVPDMYTLVFGNVATNGQLDDLVVPDNKDRNIILATVAFAVYEFTSKYPHVTVYFSGSTSVRTRLYRMAIAINYKELSFDFEIFGIKLTAAGYQDESFRSGIDYFGFLIKRKKTTNTYEQEEKT